jgi:hypothetical protein
MTSPRDGYERRVFISGLTISAILILVVLGPIILSILNLAGILGSAWWGRFGIPSLTLLTIGLFPVFVLIHAIFTEQQSLRRELTRERLTEAPLRMLGEQLERAENERRSQLDFLGVLNSQIRGLDGQISRLDGRIDRKEWEQSSRQLTIESLLKTVLEHLETQGAARGGSISTAFGSAVTPPPPDSFHVVIYADAEQDSEAWQRLSDSTIALARSLGYDLEREFPIEYGSIFQRAFWKRAVSSEEARYLEAPLQQALGLKMLDQAEVDSKQATAAASVIAALASIPAASVKVGSILVLKYSVAPGGDPVLLVRTLSAREVQALDRYPAILKNPLTALDSLTMAITEEEADEGPRLLVPPQGPDGCAYQGVRHVGDRVAGQREVLGGDALSGLQAARRALDQQSQVGEAHVDQYGAEPVFP